MNTPATKGYRYVMFATVLVLLCFSSNAQLKYDYHPRQTHSELSEDLIHQLGSQLEEEDKNMPRDRVVLRINFERRITFMEKVLDSAFIKDDTMENYVGNVLNSIAENNTLQSCP